LGSNAYREGGKPVDPNSQQAVKEQFFEAMRVLRVAWVIPLVAFCALALPPQVRDLYRAVAEKRYWPQIAATAVLLVLAAYLTYRIGRHRALVHGPLAAGEKPVLGLILRWGPAFCGALLLAAAAFGIFWTTWELPAPRGIDDGIDKTLGQIAVARGELRIVALALAGAAVLFLLFPLAEKLRKVEADGEPPSFAFGWAVQVIALAVAAAMVGTAFAPSVSVPISQWLGSVAIFLLFLCVLLVALSVLQSWSDRSGIPWIFVLLAWVVALAVFDRGVTHRASLVDTPPKGTGLVQVQYALLDWYRDRKDKDAYQNEPYPVYLIAAEGGGLYAAQFTAKVLARLQDRCPNFAQHVFAISSVSGGSLGASLFSSLAKKYAPNGPWQPCKLGARVFEEKVDKFLNRDFLAPIVARALFADFLQVFLPHQLIVPQFSRGRALEEAIERAWADLEGGTENPFEKPYLSHWRPGEAAPALMLNTTSVSDGRQVVISPFGLDTDNADHAVGYLHLRPEFPTDKDLRLSSAVGLSGRFPWILPVAMVGDKGKGVPLVDGAYFEGSGIETLTAIRNALRPYEVKPEGPSEFPYITVHVIVIGSVQPAVDILETIDEVTPPVRTMLNARDRRGYIAQDTLREWSQMVDCPPVRPETQLAAAVGAAAGERKALCAFRPPQLVRLNYAYFKLPLSWQISDGMRSIIERHSRGQCAEKPELGAAGKKLDDEVELARIVLMQNGQAATLVADQLWAGKRDEQAAISVLCD
jgi:hypothetical protein